MRALQEHKTSSLDQDHCFTGSRVNNIVSFQQAPKVVMLASTSILKSYPLTVGSLTTVWDSMVLDKPNDRITTYG